MNLRKFTLLMFLAASFMWACNQSGSEGTERSGNDQIPKVENLKSLEQAAKPQLQQTNATGGPDKYGRMPGDAHYNHDHPPAGQEAAPTIQTNPAGAVPAAAAGQPASGGPDKYGRMPGDAHYGHNHE